MHPNHVLVLLVLFCGAKCTHSTSSCCQQLMKNWKTSPQQFDFQSSRDTLVHNTWLCPLISIKGNGISICWSNLASGDRMFARSLLRYIFHARLEKANTKAKTFFPGSSLFPYNKKTSRTICVNNTFESPLSKPYAYLFYVGFVAYFSIIVHRFKAKSKTRVDKYTTAEIISKFVTLLLYLNTRKNPG